MRKVYGKICVQLVKQASWSCSCQFPYMDFRSHVGGHSTMRISKLYSLFGQRLVYVFGFSSNEILTLRVYKHSRTYSLTSNPNGKPRKIAYVGRKWNRIWIYRLRINRINSLLLIPLLDFPIQEKGHSDVR